MVMADGTYRLGPESGELLLKTSRSGMGRRAGHDLVIEVTRWSAEVTLAGEPEEVAVSVRVEVDSLEVRDGLGGVKPLTDKDRTEIRNRLRETLESKAHPEINFASTSVTGSAESATAEGDLTIHGRTAPITVSAELSDDRVRGSATVAQTRWGIRPYTAFLGALKVADDVEIEFDATLSRP